MAAMERLQKECSHSRLTVHCSTTYTFHLLYQLNLKAITKSPCKWRLTSCFASVRKVFLIWDRKIWQHMSKASIASHIPSELTIIKPFIRLSCCYCFVITLNYLRQTLSTTKCTEVIYDKMVEASIEALQIVKLANSHWARIGGWEGRWYWFWIIIYQSQVLFFTFLSQR